MSCLFRAISTFYDDFSTEDLRTYTCDYLKRNPYLFGDHVRVVDEPYIDKMRKSSTWGSSIEIKACCNLLRTNITIKNTRDRPNTLIEFLSECITENHIMISWNGSHYEPIIRLHDEL